MARDPSFVKTIVDSFVRTMDVQATARDLKLDPDLVRYWLGKEGFDLRGQGAYKDDPQERHIQMGATIAMLRLEKGYPTPQALAEHAGMSTRKIASLERGERDAPVSELLRLSDALGIHVSQFFQRVDEERI